MYIFNTGLGKVGLQVFVWKIIEQLINNNVRMNFISHAHNYKSAFAYPCILYVSIHISVCMYIFNSFNTEEVICKFSFLFFF